jgi:hypothetical protein
MFNISTCSIFMNNYTNNSVIVQHLFMFKKYEQKYGAFASADGRYACARLRLASEIWQMPACQVPEMVNALGPRASGVMGWR